MVEFQLNSGIYTNKAFASNNILDTNFLFSSWHTFIFSTGGGGTFNLLVQERSRSVKALFTVQRRAPSTLIADQGALLFQSSTTAGTLQNYQYRIGGR